MEPGVEKMLPDPELLELNQLRSEFMVNLCVVVSNCMKGTHAPANAAVVIVFVMVSTADALFTSVLAPMVDVK